VKKIEKRTVICLALTLFLLLGLALFLVRFVLDGGDWASFAANRHLYNSQGQLSVGRVLDRDGDVLSWVDESGQRRYYSNATVRKATLHAVGDPNGAIGTGALVAFADQLSGYNLLTGADNPFGQGNDLYLTLDARLNYIAYQALNGRKGAVGVYNYKTGEVLCMVSAPTFDPADPPEIQDGDPRYEGVYLNRFLSSRIYHDVVGCTFHRLVELWFDGPEEWYQAAVEGAKALPKPVWAQQERFPFLKSNFNIVGMFLTDIPTSDNLTQFRGYITMR